MRKLILSTLSTLALLIYPLYLSAQNSFSLSLTARVELQVSTAPSPDFDGDGTVGISDFLQFVNHFGTSRGGAGYDAKYDLDENGVIGIPDFLIFVDNFGSQVSPSGGGATVTIADANLRAVIADSLGKASGAPITRAEMATLTRLEAPNSNISDLTGLEHATNLQRLSLSNLTKLTSLSLSDNSISDISALSNLTNLTWLDLWENSISDISVLSNLTNLTVLFLSNNSISDISVLSNLTNLTVRSLRIVSRFWLLDQQHLGYISVVQLDQPGQAVS